MRLNAYIKEPQQPAQACIIWLHGLGADATDMERLVAQLPLNAPIRHVFLNAAMRPVTINNNMKMRAWYDIVGMKLTDREDLEGITQSQQLILELIAQQLKTGLVSAQIFLAGFSQGGAMALYTGLHASMSLAGVIALSAYLPLAATCNIVLDKNTPIFMAGGLFDEIVLPAWTLQCVHNLQQRGFKQLAWHTYPMQHTICLDEIRDLAQWLNLKVAALAQNCGALL